MQFRKPCWLAGCWSACVIAFAALSFTTHAQTTAPGDWTWMDGNPMAIHGGGSLYGPPGVYGTLGTPAAGNLPGGRSGQVGWTDSNGNAWIFGGTGYDSTGTVGALNDLWEFNPSTSEWAWMGGSNLICETSSCVTGVYGTLGAPAAGNFPGSRSGEEIWTDKQGNVWLFGGWGFDSAVNFGLLTDLWKFNPSTNEWAWMGGNSLVSTGDSLFGVCGTKGVFAVGNLPGFQKSEPTWVDGSGNLWMLAGGTAYYLLWEFNPSLNEWVWMGGDCASNSSSDWEGVYGAKGVPDPANHPGARSGGVGWVDASGNFWLYGGNGSDSVGMPGNLDDVWKYDPSTQEWTWMNGLSTLPTEPGGGMNQYPVVTCHPPVFGTPGVPAAENSPGCGGGAVAAWVDNSRNLWLFGGGGFNGTGSGLYADVWEFDPLSQGWAWMAGTTNDYNSDPGYWPGVYGALGTPAAENIPGYRTGATAWTDSSGNFRLFGGLGDPNSFTYANDLWMYQPPPSVMPAPPPTFSPVAGTYTTPQSVTINDSLAGVTIYYTTDRTTPTTDSAVYSDPITVSSTETIEAIASTTGYATSAVTSAVYTIVPPAATPVFSLAAGSYTAEQSVTISDSTPGATIYYTTDGTAPTTSSTLYSTPISVSSTETLEAIATATGYSDSAVASATYTINLPPPDFSVGASPASLTMTAGQSGTATVSVTPANGFNTAVSFSCSGLPAGTSCSFSPATLTPSGAAASTTLTIFTSAAAAIRRDSSPLLPISALAAVLCCFTWKRRRLQSLLLLAVSLAALNLLSACGSGSGGGTTLPPRQPVTAAVTITATSGSLQHSATVSLTVN